MNASAPQPEPWLRGPVPGIPALLQPAAHALIAAREDIERAVTGLPEEDVWVQPGGVASIGFHIAHLAGATDRLCTYARAGTLSDLQRQALARERAIMETRPPLAQLLDELREAIRRALDQLASTPEASLTEPRAVGRMESASTVIGLLFHTADHAARHAGQVTTTARIVRSAAQASPRP